MSIKHLTKNTEHRASLQASAGYDDAVSVLQVDPN